MPRNKLCSTTVDLLGGGEEGRSEKQGGEGGELLGAVTELLKKENKLVQHDTKNGSRKYISRFSCSI